MTNNILPNSRLWIYQSQRAFNESEESAINAQLLAFTTQWTAHNVALKASAIIMHHRFILIMVDEAQALATGCSIDKAVNVIKNIETTYDLSLFDRLYITYRNTYNEIASVILAEFEAKLNTGEVTEDTIIFDNTILTTNDIQKWEAKVKDTWVSRYVSLV